MNYIVSRLTLSGFTFCLIFLFLGLLSVELLAQSDRWYHVGAAKDRDLVVNWYLDKSTIEKSSDRVRFWDKRVMDDGSYIKERTVIYCKTRQIQMLQAFTYTSDQTQIKKFDQGSLIDIVPESISEAFYKLLCTKDISFRFKARKTLSEKDSNQNSVEKSRIKTVRVITEMANLRGDPSMDSEVLDTASRNTTFQLVNTKPVGGWFEVQFTRTTTAWIHGNTIEFIEAEGKK